MLTNWAGMLEVLVILLCKGLEAALVIGALCVHLGLTGRVEIRRFVWFGLAVTLFQILGISPDNQIYEGTIGLIASMFILTMTVCMWCAGSTMRAKLEEKNGAGVKRRHKMNNSGSEINASI